MNRPPICSPIATRVFTRLQPKDSSRVPKPPALYAKPFGERLLIFDMETRDEPAQRPLFGSFQIRDQGELVKRALIFGDSCTAAEIALLQAFAQIHKMEVLSRDQFGDLFLAEVFEIGTVCLCYNAPFDLSKMSHQWQAGKAKHRDSFSFRISRNTFRPRLRIKSLNSREAFVGLIPSVKQKSEQQFRSGRFVDAHMFIGALTDKNLSLEAACELYNVPTKKHAAAQHGILTPDYIQYNLDDVQSTYEVYEAALQVYDTLHLPTTPDKIYSTASIGKAYFAKMGIQSLAIKQPDFPVEIHGYAMESYNGARVECHIRKRVERVVYLDVLSMYPTVFVLQRLWRHIVAQKLTPRNNTAEVIDLLHHISLDALFDKAIWPRLHGLVLLEPCEDLLPVRADYRGDGSWNIGLNHLTAKPTWYTLPDVIVSVLHTGRIPRILKATTVDPLGVQEGLSPIDFFGIRLNPQTDDFFKAVIERRYFLQHKADKTPADEIATQFLKIIANSTSYGQNGEFNEQLFSKPIAVDVYGASHSVQRHDWFEAPGRYFNPYIASIVTGDARLILTMMQLSAHKLGSSYVMCDTDSMAFTDPDGRIAVALVDRFKEINPYSFAGSILKIEDENYAQ